MKTTNRIQIQAADPTAPAAFKVVELHSVKAHSGGWVWRQVGRAIFYDTLAQARAQFPHAHVHSHCK